MPFDAAKVKVLRRLLLLSLMLTFCAIIYLENGRNTTLKELDPLGLTNRNGNAVSNIKFSELKPQPETLTNSDSISKNHPSLGVNGNFEKNAHKEQPAEDETPPAPGNYSSFGKVHGDSCPFKHPATNASTTGPPSLKSQNSSASQWPYWGSGHRSLRRRARDAGDTQLVFRKTKEHTCSLKIILDSYWMAHVSNVLPYKLDLNFSINNLVQFVDYQLLRLNMTKGNLKSLGLELGPLEVRTDMVGAERNAEKTWDPVAFFSELSKYNFQGYCAGFLFTYQQLDPQYTPSYGVSMIKLGPDPKAGVCSKGKPPPVDPKATDYSAYYRNALPVNFQRGTNMVSGSYVAIAQMVHYLAILLGAPSDTAGSQCFTKEETNYATAFPIPETLAEVNQEFSPCSQQAMEAAAGQTSNCLKTCITDCDQGAEIGQFILTTTSTAVTPNATNTTGNFTTPSTTTTTTMAPSNNTTSYPVPPMTFGPYGWTETCATVFLNDTEGGAVSHRLDHPVLRMLLVWLAAVVLASL